MTRVLFVAGAHTEIGKTHVACGLLSAARQKGWTVDMLKPVVSGFSLAGWAESDPGRLLRAAARPLSLQELDRVSPWRFSAPLAPPMAAGLEGRYLPMDQVLAFCRHRIAEATADLMVVEGVGGLMSPIADGATTLDLLQALPGESILVGGSYLGAVSHTLTALEVMMARAARPACVVISESAEPEAPDFAGSARLLAEHVTELPVVEAGRGADNWASSVLEAVGS
jgi:dethiobiotin synthetase